jgi:hypothetical protein
MRSLRNLRTAALLVGLLAGTSAIACSSAQDEGDDTEGALGTFDRSTLFSGKWTNWYDRNVEAPKNVEGIILNTIDRVQRKTRGASVVGLFKLSAMRKWLLEENLFDTNPTKKVEKIGEADVRCDERSQVSRRIDGTCNDQQNPAMGAANVRFGRNVPLDSAVPGDLLSPSPREISRKLLSRPVDASGQRKVQEVPFLNLLALTWIQYMNHDWFSHGEIEQKEGVTEADLIQVPLAQDDPFRQEGLSTMVVRKTSTRADAIRTPGGKTLPTYYNENTHWWDGSQLYGSSKAVADSLRKNEGGVLKAELDLPDNMLPVKDGQEQSGFIRNWWIGLDLMHTLFAREHNQIVAMLRQSHPELAEDDLYDKARMINAAGMAKIHTIEWTPAILPNPGLNLGMHSNWYGAKTAIFGMMKKDFFGPELEGLSTDLKVTTFTDTLAAMFGVYDGAINGLVSAPKRDLGKNNVPFTLTEEFTSVYRLHSLLPENLVFRSAAGTQSIPTAETRLEKSATVRQQGMSAWMASFGLQKPGQLVLHNFPAFLQDINIPSFKKYDIGAIDILRDRERGVPRYNEFRKLIQLQPLDNIDQISDDPNVVRELKEMYNNDINKVDLLVGTLAEGHRPDMFGFGETQFQIFILMASRRLMGDRFYADGFNAKNYTAEGIKWIQGVNFKTVVSRNFPDIAPNLANIENGFKPWDGSAGKAVPTHFTE